MKAWLGSLRFKHASVLAGAVLGAWVGAQVFGWQGRLVSSVALGGGLQMINLWWLERSVRSWVERASLGLAGGVSHLARLRLVLLLGVVAAVLIALPVHPIGFAVGLTTGVPSVLWYGLSRAGREV